MYLIILYIFGNVQLPLYELHLMKPGICQVFVDVFFHLNFSCKLGLGSLRYFGQQNTNSWQVCSFSYHWQSA